MEGRGVTNYDTTKPSYAFSTSTTEFDDALMQRDIVTLEQAMMAKGASISEAQRLASLKRQEEERPIAIESLHRGNATRKDASDEGSSSEDDDDDDDFMRQYRQRRLQEIKKEGTSKFGQVIPIARDEWTRHVNEASQHTWVVVTLTSSDVERTGCVERASVQMAGKFGHIKFVSIPSQQAIPDWPEANLPTLFLYRYGKMQHQLIRLPVDMAPDQLEWMLAEHAVVETDLREAPDLSTSLSNGDTGIRGYHGISAFGGTGAQLSTRHTDDQDAEDF